ncbi:MAG TPA: metal-dependent transcriptional regulator [Candidatus Poseidoniaceae archaeon]|nr:MAG TPA: metal-dependent transcriptional regulator [Candidatus Poseidoniales archaeon]HII23656.1 metal-dependent transcriptional regulator [Candidatus Poseidoniaceae archaeon]|tara:strand:+ start:386 stop:1039 length:654 start_codon:yes stop_codon:yes gene_type:complete
MSAGHFQEFEDEYLEMMYQFYEKDPDARVRTGDLAEALRVTPASTTEMVQRLASKGYLEYIPYKGSTLTDKGLVYGKKMKRRHRLAEVLLQHLPFDGNQHATACRLEHAIDDDLEVALTIYFNNPQIDPSGTPIPSMSEDIESRVNTSIQDFKNLNQLSQGESSTIKMIVAGKSDIHFLNNLNIAVGAEIKSIEQGSYQVADMTVQLSKEIADRIII